jgi:hypothetical protein
LKPVALRNAVDTTSRHTKRINHLPYGRADAGRRFFREYSGFASKLNSGWISLTGAAAGLILHFAVTAHPTAEWTAQQMREAFPWDDAPRYLLRDRDRIFGKDFVDLVKAMGIQQVLSTPRSPWQRAYLERVIGTIRRECLDHMIIFNERCLYRHLKSFTDYYHRSRAHLALQKDSPEPRPIQPPEAGRIIAIPEVGGLHHRYERRAAGTLRLSSDHLPLYIPLSVAGSLFEPSPVASPPAGHVEPGLKIKAHSAPLICFPSHSGQYPIPPVTEFTRTTVALKHANRTNDQLARHIL